MTSTEKEQLIKDFVFSLAENFGEEEAFVLVCLHKAYSSHMELTRMATLRGLSADNGGAMSAKKISAITNYNIDKTRLLLSRLHAAGMVSRNRVDHSWYYEINENGALALDCLLDKERFPGRRDMIMGKLEGGYSNA